MKNLRNLLRRYRKTESQPRAQRARRADATQRRLSTETLERRELLAAGILESHNPWNQFDVNNDRAITARDALGVINYLGRGESEEAPIDGERMFYDVNGDNAITALDALSVINAIGRGEGMEEPLIELLLTAREYGGTPGGEEVGFDGDLVGPSSQVQNGVRTVPDANEIINVEVGEVFELEVSYEDLRLFTDRLGAFQLITDIVTSQQDVLTPVLFETQQLVVNEAIKTVAPGDRAQTTITLSIPNSPPGLTGDLTYESTFNAFGASPTNEVRNALTAFGYTNDQYFLSTPEVNENIGAEDVAVEIHWTDLAFADMDLPNIDIEVNEAPGADEIPGTEFAIAPFIDNNGTQEINPAAIPFNLNVFSRQFNNNEPFYNANNNGAFDPSIGFLGLQGIGGVPSQGGGIPQLAPVNGYPQGPFDAYSFAVRINQPVTELEISVRPNASQGDDTEAILIYGEDDRVPISNDTVIIEGRSDVDMSSNGKATIIVTATDAGGNQDPVVSDTVSATFNEDQGTQSVDLLQFASDPDGDTLSITSIDTGSTDPNGAVTQNGTSINVTPDNYGDLNDGQSQAITVNYTISDGNGGTVDTSALITITGITDVTNQNPEVSDTVSATFNEDQGTQSVDLLQFASDPDGDTLTVSNVNTGSTDPNGAVTQNGNSINVTPGSYGDLNDGQSQAITVNYTISDGNGGTVDTSALITITGITDVTNQNPEVSDTVSATFNEDQGTQSVDLLQFASDPDGDTLSITSINTGSTDPNGAVSQNGTSINVTPGSYGDLNDGQSQAITVNYTISDGNGGTVDTSALITITGITDVTNQNPEVSDTVSATFNEDQGTQSVDLLQFASDPDGDTLTVSNVNTGSTDPNGAVTQNGNSINVTPGSYGDLNDGQSQAITVNYTISDGNGGTVDTSALITITGITDFVNSDPTATPLSESVSEADSSTVVDLLANANDVDGDTLSVSGLALDSGNPVGITIGTNSLTVDPDDYRFLLPGESEVIRYTYDVIDGNGGSVSTTATITINGAIDDAPTTGNVPDAMAFTGGSSITIDVLGPANAGADEDQDLSITAASLGNPAAGILTFNGVLDFTPADGFEGETTISYTISDGNSSDNGSVNLSVMDFNPSTIGGGVFIDRIENMPDVIHGADPFRDGVKDENEQGLGGVPITLAGNDMQMMTYTDVNGTYEFVNVAPGTYEIMYDKPDNIIYFGPTTMSVTIGDAGGVTDIDNNFALIGLTASATSSIDILARTYLNGDESLAATTNNGREGAIVSWDSTGMSNFFMAGEGFEDVQFADVRMIDDSDTDAALLTVLTEDGDVMSTLIPHDHALVGPDGSTMRFFGGMDDFPFQHRGSNVTSFDDFQTAIDQILSEDE